LQKNFDKLLLTYFFSKSNFIIRNPMIAAYLNDPSIPILTLE